MKNFNFQIPVELIKGDDDDWRIQGVASTDDEDLQGEIVSQNGLDISVLKSGRGIFNYDHQKGPENVLGEVEDADFVDVEGKKGLMVKGYLFKHQDRAKAFYNILKSLRKGSSPRVHMSIEGKVLQRDLGDHKKIKKARVEKVALTLDPVNPYTFAQLVKSLASNDAPSELESSEVKNVEEYAKNDDLLEISRNDLEILVDLARKALSAGAGYSKTPQSRTGGGATTSESLESCPKTVTYGKKDKKIMVKSIIDSLSRAYPNENPLDLARWAIEAFIDRLNKE